MIAIYRYWYIALHNQDSESFQLLMCIKGNITKYEACFDIYQELYTYCTNKTFLKWTCVTINSFNLRSQLCLHILHAANIIFVRFSNKSFTKVVIVLINLDLTQGFPFRMWQQTHYIVVYVQLGLFKSMQGCNYRKISNIGAPNPKLKCSSSRHAFVFAQYTEAKC